MKPIVHAYEPWGTAKAVFKCKDPEILVSGPAGTGKSRACLEKMHFMALMNPGMRGLIVRKTLTSLSSTALVTWREHVAKESLMVGDCEYYGGSTQESAQYRYTNGSVIVLGGMDKATRVMSSEYDVIYVQEAIELTENDWEALTTRLRNGKVSFQQLIADANPSTPTHWLKTRCDKGKTRMFNSVHEENPVYFTRDGKITQKGQAYITRLDNLTGVRYQRLRRGQWVAAEGLIYEDWNSAVHVVDRFTIPQEWTRWWTVDFGFVHPFVLQCWAEDPDGRLYLYREIFHSRRIVDDHARQIMSIVAPGGNWVEPKPRAVICDHDAEGRATLSRVLGMGTQPANKKVTEGIQAVQQRLRPQADGKPRLFILRDSTVEIDPQLAEEKHPTSTVEEIPGYIWDITQGKTAKESPVKVEDDGCDALRYMVAQLDLGGRPRFRSF